MISSSSVIIYYISAASFQPGDTDRVALYLIKVCESAALFLRDRTLVDTSLYENTFDNVP